MSNIAYLRKDDAESEARKQAAIQVLEEAIESVRSNKSNGMLIVAFEKPSGGPDVEMTVQRYYLSGGVCDMLTLLGLTKCVTDEISEGTRLSMDME